MTAWGLFGPKKSIPPAPKGGGAKKSIPPGKGGKPGKGGSPKGGGGKKAIRLAVAVALVLLLGCWGDDDRPHQTCSTPGPQDGPHPTWSYRCEVTP